MFAPPFALVKTVALFFPVSLTVGQARTSTFSENCAYFLVSIQSPVTACELSLLLKVIKTAEMSTQALVVSFLNYCSTWRKPYFQPQIASNSESTLLLTARGSFQNATSSWPKGGSPPLSGVLLISSTSSFSPLCFQPSRSSLNPVPGPIFLPSRMSLSLPNFSSHPSFSPLCLLMKL